MLNLYNILLEQIDCNQLIEEGKDPREVLHYKFQNVPSDVIDAVINIDPTKKKSYSQWLLSKWNDESDVITKALENGRIAKLFDHYKNHNEIQIKDCPSVQEGLDNFVPEEDTVLTKSSAPTTYIANQDREVDSELANDFDIIFDDDNWIIAVPNTYEAAGKLGENTKWCTTGCYGSDSYYHQYLRQGGKYYVNFDMSQSETLKGKDYPFKRYQFHFESKQFMDSHDDPVSAEEMNIPESVIDFYQEIDSDYVVGEKSWEERYEEYCEERYHDSIRINDDLYLNVSFDEELEYSEPSLDYNEWYIFSEDDDRDPISWTEVNPHIEESLIVNTDKLIVIKKERSVDDTYVIFEAEQRRYGQTWEEVGETTKIVQIPEYDDIYLSIMQEKGYGKSRELFLSTIGMSDGRLVNSSVYFSGEENIIFNPNNLDPNEFSYEGEGVYAFIEMWNDGDYHSLFALTDSELYCIIRRDLPVDNEHFYINEDLEVVGQFRTYPLETDYDDDSVEYHLVSELDDGNYLVEYTESGYYDNKTNNWYSPTDYQTILDRETKQPIGDVKFDEFICPLKCGYRVKTNNRKSENIVTFDGNYLFNTNYGQILTLDENGIILACQYPKNRIECETYDLYDSSSNQMLLSKVIIDTSHKPNNGELIVGVYNEENGKYEKKLYNIYSKEFLYTDFNHVETLPGNRNLLLGKDDNEIYSIVDLLNHKVIINNISSITKARGMNNYCYLYKTTQGNYNALYVEEGKYYILFGNDVQKINDSGYNTIIGTDMNDNKFAYNVVQGKYLFKNLPYTIIFSEGGPGLDILCNNVKFTYRISDNEIIAWGNWSERHATRRIDNETPEEVINTMNTVMQYANNNAPAMAESFKRMLNRINEARKLNCRDIF